MEVIKICGEAMKLFVALLKELKISLAKLFEPLGDCPAAATNGVATEEQSETT